MKKECSKVLLIQSFAVFLLATQIFSLEAFALCGSDQVVKATSDRVDGLPPVLCKVLVELTKTVGKISVVSGFRNSGDNERRGGARNSMHLPKNGGAIDFVYPDRGSREVQKKLLSKLRELGQIRYNIYPSWRTHIDASRRLPNSYQSAVEKKNYKRGRRVL